MSGRKHIIDIRCSAYSARIEYIAKVLTQYWDAEFNIVDKDCPHSNLLISYGPSLPGSENGAIRIPQSNLLFEKGIRTQDFQTKSIQGRTVAFALNQEDKNYDLQFDLLAFIFYCLSRYEEYGASDLDIHGRFQSKNSWASKNQCLNSAHVDHAIFQLEDLVFQKYNIRLERRNKYSVQASYDIDMPYAYKGKGWKAYLGIFRDLITGNWGGMSSRVNYWINGEDPFDQYNLMHSLSKEDRQPYCFVLQNWKPPHDLNHIVESAYWHSIVQKLAAWTHIGIHPSYESNYSLEKLQLEFQRLENIVCPHVTRSRQHFLKMTMPTTYRQLEQLDILEDHSMIYADTTGFRAGTAHPFMWYDLKEERITSLKIYPYIVMDATLRHYMKQTPSEALECISVLRKEVESVGGRFGFIWHNSSMSKAYGWAPWLNVLKACLRDPLRHDSHE